MDRSFLERGSDIVNSSQFEVTSLLFLAVIAVKRLDTAQLHQLFVSPSRSLSAQRKDCTSFNRTTVFSEKNESAVFQVNAPF